MSLRKGPGTPAVLDRSKGVVGTEGESARPDGQERKPASIIRQNGQQDSPKSGLHPYLGREAVEVK